MVRQISLTVAAATAAAAFSAIISLSSPSCTQAFQATPLSHHHHHRPLASTVAGDTDEAKVVTSPITGSETNIKYPTKRGSEVDSRKFINYSTNNNDNSDDNSSPLLALRLSHILFASKELATQTLDKLTKAEWNFEQMATSVSNWAETREEGGSGGGRGGQNL